MDTNAPLPGAICLHKKGGFYLYQSQCGKPMIRLFPHWNWKGKAEEVPQGAHSRQ